MKTARKVLVLALCAVLLVSATIMGTMAYLTSSDVVTNTFTVGSVSITLDEAPVDVYGKVVTGDRTDANTYKLLPGHNYKKDPIIHVTQGSEECWLFVKVVDEIAAIEDTKTVATQLGEKGWTLIDPTNNIYAYASKVDARTTAQDVAVFDDFTIKQDADVASYNGKTIVVTAYAIQADGFTSAEAAWTAAGSSF